MANKACDSNNNARVLSLCLLLVCFMSAAGCHCFDWALKRISTLVASEVAKQSCSKVREESGIYLITSQFPEKAVELCTRLMVDINEVKWEQEVPKYPDCKQPEDRETANAKPLFNEPRPSRLASPAYTYDFALRNKRKSDGEMHKRVLSQKSQLDGEAYKKELKKKQQ